MKRLTDTFARLRQEKRKALVVYLTAGDPDVAGSVAAALAAVQAGADILEIGIPFSDPMADGVVIQRAMLRSLAAGGGFGQTLEVIRQVRQACSVPIVAFGYINPLLWGGIDASCKQLAAAGADGMLVVDVPAEESAELEAAVAGAGLAWVPLVAPTTGAQRIHSVAKGATGFVYMVSMTAVTGGELTDVNTLKPLIAAVHGVTSVPVCLGFGIRDRASASRAAQVADGVVVGSAVVAGLEAHGVNEVSRIVGELRTGVDAAASA